jgi:aminodeoxyfutalosine deaminase
VNRATLKQIDPSLSDAGIAANLEYFDFAGFMRSFVWVNRKLQTPEHYAMVACSLFQSLHAEGVTYAEVTLSAGVVLWKKQDLGAVFQAVSEEAARSPIPIRWILDATRQWGADAAAPVFEFAADHIKDGVVAIGLGGFEAEGPALWYRDLFAEARKKGLRLTCHAGETTNPKSIWDALEIGAERIGHGIRAVKDSGLITHLCEFAVPLEISITSNVRTGAVGSLDVHPLRTLFDAGVPVILNTDDPAIFNCTLTDEYALAATRFGFSEAELQHLAQQSFRYAF